MKVIIGCSRKNTIGWTRRMPQAKRVVMACPCVAIQFLHMRMNFSFCMRFPKLVALMLPLLCWCSSAFCEVHYWFTVSNKPHYFDPSGTHSSALTPRGRVQDLVWSLRGLGGMVKRINGVTSECADWKELHDDGRIAVFMLDTIVSNPCLSLGIFWCGHRGKLVEMNTGAMAYSVDEWEEIACSYSTKLIQGFQAHQRRLFFYITHNFCFLFLCSLDEHKQKRQGIF